MSSKRIENTTVTRCYEGYRIGEKAGRGAAAGCFHTHQIVRVSCQRQGGTVGVGHVKGCPSRGFHGFVFHHKVSLGGIARGPMGHSRIAGYAINSNRGRNITVIRTTVENHIVTGRVCIAGVCSGTCRVIIGGGAVDVQGLHTHRIGISAIHAGRGCSRIIIKNQHIVAGAVIVDRSGERNLIPLIGHEFVATREDAIVGVSGFPVIAIAEDGLGSRLQINIYRTGFG